MCGDSAIKLNHMYCNALSLKLSVKFKNIVSGPVCGKKQDPHDKELKSEPVHFFAISVPWK